MFIAHWVRAFGDARWNKRKLVAVVACIVAALLLTPDANALSPETTTQWLTSELRRLPRSLSPGETREEFDARVRLVTEAIVEEARGFADGKGWSWTELAAAASVIWHSETLFDRRIQSGEGHPIWHQDRGLARCGMQLHVTGIVPPDVWEKLVGSGKDALHLCAQYGLRVVTAQAKQCGVYFGQRADRARVAKMLASYGSGGNCTPGDASWKRADVWVRIMATRPDHKKKALPGYRRVGPKEIPPGVLASARRIASEIGKEPEVVPGYKHSEQDATGRVFVALVEKHAEGKLGVSVFVKE